ncbi:MAG: type II toxin-antitoxin system HicA family toxin [bacterium]|nr:type II toxin-antitoxin system HicA family toxin [bacterium]
MPRLPQISGAAMRRILIRLGFQYVGGKGSHMKFIRISLGSTKETIVVPNHKVLKKGILHDILKKLGIRIEKFKELI